MELLVYHRDQLYLFWLLCITPQSKCVCGTFHTGRCKWKLPVIDKLINNTEWIQTAVTLTQQRRSSCILSFDTSRSGEALGSVAAAVVKAQLFTRRLGGRQLLWYLLLSPPFLTPQLVTVLPQWKTGGIETTWWENMKDVVILKISVLTQHWRRAYSGGGILSGSTSLRNSLPKACSAVQRLLGSRFNMWSNRSRADGGMLENRSTRIMFIIGTTIHHVCIATLELMLSGTRSIKLYPAQHIMHC